jgi:hypothetical protein
LDNITIGKIMTQQTLMLLQQIAATQNQLALLADAQNQITKAQTRLATLQAAAAASTDPDPVFTPALLQQAVVNATAQLSTAADALGVTLTATPASPANPAQIATAALS